MNIKYLLLDIDGVITHQGKPTPKIKFLLDRIIEKGIIIRFVTKTVLCIEYMGLIKISALIIQLKLSTQ